MAVKFAVLGGGGGSNGAFTDTFQRANVGEGAGPNWTLNRTQFTVDASRFSINNNLLRWTQFAGVGTGVSYLFPLPCGALYATQGQAGAASLQAPSHFAEITISADNSVGGSLTRVGPAVSLNGLQNVGGGYYMENLPELLSFNIARILNNVPTNIVDHSATPQYSTVVGLVMKLSVEYTSPSITTLRSYINGTLIDTFQDTNVNRQTNGLPGIFGNFASVGRFCDMSKFRGGPGI